MNILLKIFRSLKRWRAAKNLGFHFIRAKNFSIPKSIVIKNVNRTITVPNDAGSAAAFIGILLDDEYGVKHLPVKQPISRLIDIGGHAGLFSLKVLEFFHVNKHEIYEPNKNLSETLIRNMVWSGAKVIPKAVGLHGGSARIHCQAGDTLASTCTADPQGDIELVPWSEVTAGTPIDILKMDCEGYEWPILLQEGSLSQIKVLLLEYHPREGCNLDTVKQCLKREGMKMIRHVVTGGGCGVVTACRV